MTRAPESTDGHYSTWLYRWECDRPGCKVTGNVPVPKRDLPSEQDMQAAGWFVARWWGDRCPVCVAAGLLPNVPAHGVVSAHVEATP